jgi:RNA polymerase sigma-70 factor (ECF subfamily)
MSICEERQETGRPARFSRQPRRRIPSSPRARASVLLPDHGGESRETSPGQADATGGDRLLAYAVYKATDAEMPQLSSRKLRARRRGRRFPDEDVSDEMLLKGVAEGDKAAMHIMFARHRARVFRFIHRTIRNPVIVDDIVSQVFLDVWRSARNFEQRARVSTWLLSIARFKAISFLKERKYESIDQDDVLAIADTTETPEAALTRRQTDGILRTCLDELSPAHREIIELFYYRDKSITEVSKMIGIPLATVKSRMFYARKQLARILVSAGFETAMVRG